MRRKLWLLLVATAMLGVSAPRSRLGPSYLVKDLNVAEISPNREADIEHSVESDEIFYFSVRSTRGSELWQSDGTTAGTQVLFSAGREGRIRELNVLDGIVFFALETYPPGRELWRSDGTAEGTRMLKVIAFGPYYYSTDFLTPFRGALYFVVAHGYDGPYELWRTDGTAEGTSLAFELAARPYAFQVVGDRIYFTVSYGYYGEFALYVTDGTSAGTRGVRSFDPVWRSQVCPGSCPPFGPYPLGELNGKLFLMGTHSTYGAEPWMSDGTTAGTFLLRDILPGTEIGFSRLLLIHEGVAYFSANDGIHGTELWRTDGTPQGTRLVYDLHPGMTGSSIESAVIFGNALIFTARNDHDWAAAELWRSDGTASGTRPARELDPFSFFDARNLVVAGDSVLFAAADPAGGQELWKTNGTEAGTVRVADILPGPVGSSPRRPVTLGNDALFVVSEEGNVSSLWRSDGTRAGTLAIRPLESPGSKIRLLDRGAGSVFFVARPGDSDVADLWRSDGSETGTVRLTSPPRVSASTEYPPYIGVELNGAFLFRAEESETGFELWRADGTGGGSSLVKDLLPGPLGSFPGAFGRLGPWVLFAAHDPAAGYELHRSDGTEIGTTIVKDIRPGPDDSAPYWPIEYGGIAYFSADDGSRGRELWRSDGTDGGTRLVKDINPGSEGSDPFSFFVVQGRLLFRACATYVRCGIWKSDGTESGTVQVREFSSFSSFPFPVLVSGDLLYLASYEGLLWRSDGTDSGTFPVRGQFRVRYSAPETFASLDRRLVFAARSPEHGEELWITDGTEAGTRLLADIRPGVTSSSPRALASVGGIVLFSASDGIEGWELWRTDGTPNGTWQVEDIWPGPGSSDPAEFLRAGSRVFFAADDGESGRELWSIEYADLAFRRPQRQPVRQIPFRP